MKKFVKTEIIKILLETSEKIDIDQYLTIDTDEFHKRIDESIKYLKKMLTSIKLLSDEIIDDINRSATRNEIKAKLLKLYDAQFHDYNEILSFWKGHLHKNGGKYFFNIFGNENLGDHIDKYHPKNTINRTDSDKQKFKKAVYLTINSKKMQSFNKELSEIVKWLDALKFGILSPIAAALNTIGISVQALGNFHNKPHDYNSEKFNTDNVIDYLQKIEYKRFINLINLFEQFKKFK